MPYIIWVACYKRTAVRAPTEKLSVSWQFFDICGVISYGNGWKKDVVNQRFEFGEAAHWPCGMVRHCQPFETFSPPPFETFSPPCSLSLGRQHTDHVVWSVTVNLLRPFLLHAVSVLVGMWASGRNPGSCWDQRAPCLPPNSSAPLTWQGGKNGLPFPASPLAVTSSKTVNN